MKKLIINSLVAISALTSLTSQANVTIINDIKKTLPKDYGSYPGIHNLEIAKPFGVDPDLNAKQWEMEYAGVQKPKTDAMIYFVYLDKDQGSEYATPSDSCEHLDLTDGKIIDVSIDNSDPEYPETKCKIINTKQTGLYGAVK